MGIDERGEASWLTKAAECMKESGWGIEDRARGSKDIVTATLMKGIFRRARRMGTAFTGGETERSMKVNG